VAEEEEEEDADAGPAFTGQMGKKKKCVVM
jgi:hypothetical protein